MTELYLDKLVKKHFSAGRSAFAVWLDRLCGISAVIAVSGLIMYLKSGRFLFSLLFGAAAAVAAAMIYILFFRIRARVLRGSILRGLKTEYFCETLSMMDDSQVYVFLAALLGVKPPEEGMPPVIDEPDGAAEVYCLRQPYESGFFLIEEAMRCCRAAYSRGCVRLVFCVTGNISKELKSFAEISPMQIELIDGKRLYAAAEDKRLLPDADGFEGFLFRKVRTAESVAKRRISLMRVPPRRYIYIGAILLITSFFTAFPLYYRVFAGICFAAAIAVRLYGQKNYTRKMV